MYMEWMQKGRPSEKKTLALEMDSKLVLNIYSNLIYLYNEVKILVILTAGWCIVWFERS